MRRLFLLIWVSRRTMWVSATAIQPAQVGKVLHISWGTTLSWIKKRLYFTFARSPYTTYTCTHLGRSQPAVPGEVIRVQKQKYDRKVNPQSCPECMRYKIRIHPWKRLVQQFLALFGATICALAYHVRSESTFRWESLIIILETSGWIKMCTKYKIKIEAILHNFLF